MSDTFTNESSFLVGSDRKPLSGSRFTTRPGVGPASLVGTRRPGRDRTTGPSLGAQSQSQGGAGFCVVCSFAHRLLGRRSRRRGSSPAICHCGARRRRRCPAAALSEGTRHDLEKGTLLLCPSDRSGGPESPGAAWPPRAAKGNDGDSGRIVSDKMPTSAILPRRFEAKLR